MYKIIINMWILIIIIIILIKYTGANCVIQKIRKIPVNV